MEEQYLSCLSYQLDIYSGQANHSFADDGLLLNQNPKQKALPHIWDGISDDNLHLKNFVKMGDLLPPLKEDLYVLSNSFAFGGSNASLLLKREGRYD